MTDQLRDRIAAALYERERPPRDPRWPDAYAMDREVFEAMAAAVLPAVQAELDRANRERDEARQHAAAIAAQRDRLRQRMNSLADRWDYALAPDKAYARTLREQISVAPFDPEGAMTVQDYTEHGRHLWAFRCWGTETCDGWLGLGHHTQTSALAEQERHVAEAHVEPAARGCPAEALLAEILGQFQPLRPQHDPTGEPLRWQAHALPHEWDAWQKQAATQATDGSCSADAPKNEPNNPKEKP